MKANRRHRYSSVGASALVLACAVAIALVSGCACVRDTGRLEPPTRTPVASETPLPQPVAPEFAGAVAPPDDGAYLGLYRPPAPFDMEALKGYSPITNKSPAILMWYQPWAEEGPNRFDPAMAVLLYQRGQVPMITWEPWNPGDNANFVRNPSEQSRYKLANIVRGDFDPYIREFAQDVASVRGPVMIRPLHEMNGTWYPWCGTVNGNKPKDYVRAWRHIHDIFEEEGAVNVTWVWSINHESVPDTKANAYEVYYPGDEYVDWVAMSGFNWGTSSPYSSWRSFEHWYKKPLGYLKTTGKPIIISEFASVEQGGDKAKWIRDAYGKIRTEYPFVKGVVYYDSKEVGPENTQDWRIQTSSESAKAYRQSIADDFFIAAPAPILETWASGLTEENELYLESLQAVY